VELLLDPTPTRRLEHGTMPKVVERHAVASVEVL
jgi:hypothetical protein